MKLYEMLEPTDQDGYPNIVESKDGEYYKAEDVQPLIDTLNNIIELTDSDNNLNCMGVNIVARKALIKFNMPEPPQ